MRKLVILILLIIPLTLFAKEYSISTNDFKYEKKAMEFYCKGDMNNYFKNILLLIKENPSSPLSQYYILTLGIDKNIIKEYDEIYPVLENIINKKNNIDFFTYNLILEKIITYYINNERFEDAELLFKKTGIIDRWKYIGPFINTYYDDINNNFLGLDASLNFNKIGNRIWENLPFKTDWGWVPLDTIIYPYDKSTSYSGCNIDFPYTGNFIVWLTSQASIKLFIDGTTIFTNDTGNNNSEMNILYRVRLSKGWHHFVVKTSPIYTTADFELRVLDEHGKNIEYLKTSVDEQEIKKSKITYKKFYPTIYNFFLNKIKLNPFTGRNYIYSGLLDFNFFSINRGIKQLIKGTTSDESNNLLKYYLGRLYYYRYITEQKSSDLEKAKEIFDDIVKHDKNFVIAKEYLAKCYLNSGKIDDTYKILMNISSQYTGIFTVYSRYFKEIEWKYLSIKNIRNAYTDNKNYLFASRYWANSIEEYNFNEAGRIYKENFEKDYTQNADFFEYCLKSNRFTDLLSGLDRLNRISKYSKNYYVYLAKYYERTGKIKEAIAVLEKLFAISPFPVVAELIGNLYYDLKDYKSAKKYWLRSTALKPQNLAVENKLDYLQYKKPSGITLEEKFYKVNVEDIISKAFDDKPSQNSLKYYLDLMIISVNNNGTYKYLVHQIVKILNEQGKEKYGETEVPADNNVKIIRIGTYIDKNTFLDATDYKYHNNKNYISLPSLEIGSVIEICYEVTVDVSWFDNTPYFYYSPFMFQDKDNDIENSIFVLVQPQNSAKIRFSLKNGKDIENNEKIIADKLVQIWKKDYSKAVDVEFNSPPLLDIIPNIIVSSIPDWDTFAKWYWGKIKSKFIYDFDLEQRILDLYEKSKIGGKISKLNIIKNVYYWIQKNIVSQQDYLYYPKYIDEIYFKKEGNTEEKVLLMKYILEKLNIDSNIVLVRNNNFSKMDFSLPTPDAFNSILLMANINEKNIFIDLSNKYIPFGYVDFTHITKKGFMIQKSGEYKFINIKPYFYNSIVQEEFQLNLKKDRIDVNGDIFYTGSFNKEKEDYDNSTTRESSILERINRCYDGINITTYSISNIENIEKDLSLKFNAEIDLLNSDKKVDLILDKLKMSEKYISSHKRKYPLKIYLPIIKRIKTVITLPEKVKLKRTDNLSLNLQESFGSYYFKASMEKNQVIIDRYINLLPATISVEQYEKFLDFCKKIDKIEEEKFTIADGDGG